MLSSCCCCGRRSCSCAKDHAEDEEDGVHHHAGGGVGVPAARHCDGPSTAVRDAALHVPTASTGPRSTEPVPSASGTYSRTCRAQIMVSCCLNLNGHPFLNLCRTGTATGSRSMWTIVKFAVILFLIGVVAIALRKIDGMVIVYLKYALILFRILRRFQNLQLKNV